MSISSFFVGALALSGAGLGEGSREGVTSTMLSSLCSIFMASIVAPLLVALKFYHIRC